MEAGAYDVVVKPIGESTLLLSVHRALEAHRLRGQVRREQEELVTTLTELLKDLEHLYGADGLSAHFTAFLDQVHRRGRLPARTTHSTTVPMGGKSARRRNQASDPSRWMTYPKVWRTPHRIAGPWRNPCP